MSIDKFTKQPLRISFLLLCIITFIVTVAMLVKNPELQSVTIIRDPTTSEAEVIDQEITFQIRTKLDIEPEISVFPAASFTITKNTVGYTLRFDESLSYQTDYTVRAKLVKNSKTHTDNYQFTTKKLSYVFTQRNKEDDDKLYFKRGDELNELISAKEIILSASTGEEICSILNILPPQELVCVKLDGSITARVSLSDYERVISLKAGNNTIILSVTGNTNETMGRLYVYQLSSNKISALLNSEGRHIQSLDYTLTRDGKTIFYADTENIGVIMQLQNTSTFQAIGGIQNVGNFTSRSDKVSYINKNGAIEFITSDGKRNSLVINRITEHYLIDDEKLFFLKNYTSPITTLPTIGLFYAAKSDEETNLYNISSKDGILLTLSATPNNEIAATEIATYPLSYDTYDGNAKPTNTETLLIHKNGQVIDRFYGVDILYIN